MTDKLSLYNGALEILGSRRLSALTDNVESRRVLDDIWDRGALDACLEQGLWNFAKRSVMATYSPSITPPFGYTYAFSRPTDYVRLMQISSDENFTEPYLLYSDEGGYWFMNIDTIYISYVSNDSSFGGDYSLWPQTFCRFVEAYLAFRGRERIAKGGISEDRVIAILNDARTEARSKDAMEDPTRFLPTGSWRRARSAGRNRGSRWNGQ